MTSTKTILEPTLADAFEVGRREGLKEAFSEIQRINEGSTGNGTLRVYLEARLKSIQDFSIDNPFKQKDTNENRSS